MLITQSFFLFSECDVISDHGHLYPVVGGGVGAECDGHPEVPGPVPGAPHAGPRHPEHLRGAEAETRQQRLLTVLRHPGL